MKAFLKSFCDLQVSILEEEWSASTKHYHPLTELIGARDSDQLLTQSALSDQRFPSCSVVSTQGFERGTNADIKNSERARP
jgi:hypothetical protein